MAILFAALLTLGGAVRSVAVHGRLPEPVPNAMVEANLHLQQGRWEEAAAHYATVVAISPGERHAWFYLGVALASLGDRQALARAHADARRQQPAMAAALRSGAEAAAQWRSLDPAERARIHRGSR